MGMTTDEIRLLLYFETQAVDYGGALESVRMNSDDMVIARRWNENGFVSFGRIAFHDIKKHNGIARDYWCVLSDEAWKIAHDERKARCLRVMSRLTVERKGFGESKSEPRPND